MKVLIIEDEPLVAKDLESRLRQLSPDAEVAGPLVSVVQAKTWLTTNPLPDLILSDIQLSDGISFEVFEALHLPCPIIFTTAYDEYAIRAFKLNSIDYLLKPIDAGDLDAALKKYKSTIVGSTVADQLKAMMASWGKENRRYKERFLALQRNTLVPVTADEIAFFHKEELIFIHTFSNEKMIGEHPTLDEIENLLDPARFFRVNRQYIIHIQSVARVKSTHKGLSVQLRPPFNTELEISREKAVAFKNWLG
ncbi:MAG TPA: LytTR family DNA-binding domain-containing protein [Cyclobacteriaceae bacterium]|nr:LytTR family DNA-binding domain-containing protein [Cyclobacteriaceae bacterium]